MNPREDWLELIANVAKTAVAEEHFRSDIDTEQFAHDLNGVMLAYHHARRLLKDPRAEERARRAFNSLVDAARARPSVRASKTRTS